MGSIITTPPKLPHEFTINRDCIFDETLAISTINGWNFYDPTLTPPPIELQNNTTTDILVMISKSQFHLDIIQSLYISYESKKRRIQLTHDQNDWFLTIGYYDEDNNQIIIISKGLKISLHSQVIINTRNLSNKISSTLQWIDPNKKLIDLNQIDRD
jgi:hypothetical protein